MEKKINSMRNKLKKSSLKRLKTGGSVEGEILYVDILRHIEHIGDFSLNITQSLKIMS
jgi:phosphate:Na+ symporter